MYGDARMGCQITPTSLWYLLFEGKLPSIMGG